MASSSGHQKVQDDFPNEVKVQMKQFQELLGQLRTALKPLTENKVASEQEADGKVKQPLATARADVTTCYAVNSLFWVYLIASGENPKDHDVKRELNRLKVSMTRVKDLTCSARGPQRTLKLDVPTVARILKHNLPQAKDQDGEEEGDDEEESRRRRKRLRT